MSDFKFRVCATIVTTSMEEIALPTLVLTQTGWYTQRESAKTAT